MLALVSKFAKQASIMTNFLNSKTIEKLGKQKSNL